MCRSIRDSQSGDCLAIRVRTLPHVGRYLPVAPPVRDEVGTVLGSPSDRLVGPLETERGTRSRRIAARDTYIRPVVATHIQCWEVIPSVSGLRPGRIPPWPGSDGTSDLLALVSSTVEMRNGWLALYC